MAKSSKPESGKKSVKVNELPAAEKKLTAKEMKKVKGGITKVGPGTIRLHSDPKGGGNR